MTNVTVYTTPGCVQCNMTKKHLKRLGIHFTSIDVSVDEKGREKVTQDGYRAAPVIYADVVDPDTGEPAQWYGYRPDRLTWLAAAL